MNRLELIGHVGGNPEVKYTDGRKAVVSLSLATTEKWKDKSGEKQEKTEWHTLVFWEKLAEIVGEYIRKGDKLFVSGPLVYEKWVSKEGAKMTSAKMRVREMEMLGSPKGKADNAEKPEQEGPGAMARRKAKEEEEEGVGADRFEARDEDILF